jgi:hypothetical protein
METFFDILVTFATRSFGRTGQVYGDGNKFLNVGVYVPHHTVLYATRQYPSHPAMRESQISQAGVHTPLSRQQAAHSQFPDSTYQMKSAQGHIFQKRIICCTAMLTRLSLHHCWLLLPSKWQNVIHRAFIGDNTLADLVVSMHSVPSALIFKNYAVRPRRKFIDFLLFVQKSAITYQTALVEKCAWWKISTFIVRV